MVRTATRSETQPNAGVRPVKRMVPVKWWASLGAVYVALDVYLLTRWFASGPRRTPPGDSTLPNWMRMSIDIQLVVGWVLCAIVIYLFLIRPWIREKQLTLDGMFVIAFASLYWQDSLQNAVNPGALWNSRIINWGSWDNFIPGWRYPNGERVAEILPFGLPMYIWALFTGTVFLCYVMRRAKERRPHLSKWKIGWICFGCACLIDVIEPFWVRTGIYVWTAVPTPSWLTLWDKHWYQFPLHEPLLFGLTWTSWACVRYFKNDRGQTIAERGIDQLTISPKRKQGLRLLALIGIMNLLFFVTYMIPAIPLSLYNRAWPEDIVKRSYFTNMLCGPGTDRHCPDPRVPIPHGSPYTRGESVYTGVDGTLVIPPSNDLPDQPPQTGGG